MVLLPLKNITVSFHCIKYIRIHSGIRLSRTNRKQLRTKYSKSVKNKDETLIWGPHH